MTKRALITGITGMDGSHLADYLLDLGYDVHGIVRRTSNVNTGRISHILDQITIHEGDLIDQGSISRIVLEVEPDEIYNLAAQSFVGVSWTEPVATAQITGLGAVRVFEAARSLYEKGLSPRVYQASTSEMFGNSAECPQSEITPLKPHSPYGSAKVYAHQTADIYRKSFKMFISCGMLFNHESYRRGEEFVTRKITRGVAEIVAGQRDQILLGNLESRRDWGYAPDYVKSMHLMLQHHEPDDFVIATGVTRTIKDFLDAAFGAAGIEDWRSSVGIDQRFFRPVELHELRGDFGKAQQVLGWTPETRFKDWVADMVTQDISALSRFN